MNALKSAFWEYPEFTEENRLQSVIEESRLNDRAMYIWLLKRLLEHGRAVDALKFFPLAEIEFHLPQLKLSDYAARKWRRLTEVYREA